MATAMAIRFSFGAYFDLGFVHLLGQRSYADKARKSKGKKAMTATKSNRIGSFLDQPIGFFLILQLCLNYSPNLPKQTYSSPVSSSFNRHLANIKQTSHST